jgi:hypothetical protein
MKMAGKQSTLLFIVIIALILLAYIVFIQNPESATLIKKQQEYKTVQAKRNQIAEALLAGDSLNAELDAYGKQIQELEQKLIPEIQTQVIAQKLQSKFIEHGIPFITITNTDPAVEDHVLQPDGVTESPNYLKSVRFNIQVCGTDGVNRSILDEGTTPPVTTNPATPNAVVKPYKIVGYDEFIKAVKDIEDDLPASIKIKSIKLEDSGQGFMFYNVSVVVYSFVLPSYEGNTYKDNEYMNWNGTPIDEITKDGLIGIPFELIPESLIEEKTYRPFALEQVIEETPTPEAP